MSSTRPNIDDTLLRVAGLFARHSTCARANVGAVVTVDGRIVSSGYNGAPSGMEHCEHPAEEAMSSVIKDLSVAMDVPLTLDSPREPCRTSVHAEANAVAFAARNGVSLYGGTVYTTVSPCVSCAQLLINAGIIRVLAARLYRDPAGVELLQDAGIVVVIMDDVELP